MAYINHRDLALLNELLDDNLTAWEGEEDSVKSEHRELIDRLQGFELKAEPLELRIVMGEHPFDPYEPMDVFLDEAGAQYRAADLTRSFLKAYWDIKHGDDAPLLPVPKVTIHNWSEIAEKYGNDEDFIQNDRWGAWWVGIVPKEVIDAA